MCDCLQYHALGMLYHIRRNDKLAVTKLVSKFSKHTLKSPYAYCLLVSVHLLGLCLVILTVSFHYRLVFVGLFPGFSMTKHSQTHCSVIFGCGVEVAVLVCLTILDLNLFQILCV